MTSQLVTGAAARVTIEIPGGPIAALQAGADDATPVLLVPGFTGSKEDFGPTLDLLAEAGYRASAIDLRGQYESPGAGDPAAYTVEALGADIRAVADALGGQVHAVGHSFGGLVCRAAAIATPSRFASLTLMCSGPAGLDDSGRRARMKLLRPVLQAHGMTAVYDALQAIEQSEPGYVERPAEVAAFLRRRFLAGDPAMLLGMGDALLDEPDRVDDLAATGIALLVMYGAGDDTWLPAQQAAMARRLGVAPVEVLGAAHSPAIENPSFTSEALVAFWRSAG